VAIPTEINKEILITREISVSFILKVIINKEKIKNNAVAIFPGR
jgi:hypothetical protein